MNRNIRFLGGIPETLNTNLQDKCILENEKGNFEARNKLILHNIRLVISVINEKFYKSFFDMEDLLSIGIKGLIDGVDHYKSSENSNYSYYLAKCIENSILVELKHNNPYYKNTYNDKYSFKIDDTENEFYDFIPSDEIVEEKVIKKIYKEKIYEMISSLPEKEKVILIYRYGFYNSPIIPRDTLGKLYNTSGSNIALIEKSALKKKKELYMKFEEIEVIDDKSVILNADTLKRIELYLKTLTKEEKLVFDLFYSIYNNEAYSVARIVEITGKTMYDISITIKKSKKLIKDKDICALLEKRRKNTIKNSRIIKFFDYFKKYNFTKEEILTNYKKLPKDSQEKLIKVFGENLNTIDYFKILDRLDLQRTNAIMAKLLKNMLKEEEKKLKKQI